MPLVERKPLGRSGSSLRESLVDPRRTDTQAPPAKPIGAISARPWVLSTLGALGLVIAMVFGTRWVWAKLGGRTATRHSPVVEVLSRTLVAPRNHILLVRVAGRVLVVGDSAHGLRTLADLRDSEEVADVLQAVSVSAEASISRGFAQMLRRVNGEYRDQERVSEERADDYEEQFDRARESVGGLLGRLRAMSQARSGR